MNENYQVHWTLCCKYRCLEGAGRPDFLPYHMPQVNYAPQQMTGENYFLETDMLKVQC